LNLKIPRRIDLLLILQIALAALVPQQAASADKHVLCIQEAFRDLGYEPGAVDGVLGRRTSAALERYVHNHAGRDVPFFEFYSETGAIDAKNARQWCAYLTERHPKSELAGYSLRKANNFPNHDVWQIRLKKGWILRIYGWNPGEAPSHLAVYAHGDDLSFDGFATHCRRSGWLLPDGAALACVFRPYSTDGKRRRQPEEVAEFTRVIKLLNKLWPDVPLHCSGQSSGGHLCLAAAQQPNAEFGCVVAVAPPAANKLFEKLTVGKLKPVMKRAYDPIDHVSATKGREITIVGDRADPVVSYKVWDAFIAAAAKHGIEVNFIEAPGMGHVNARFNGIEELAKCIKRQISG
jgi:hypothetical protein